MGVINWVAFGGILVDLVIISILISNSYWGYRRGLVAVLFKILGGQNKMALIKTDKMETNKYELQFSIDAKTFEDAVEKAYRKNVKKISIISTWNW